MINRQESGICNCGAALALGGGVSYRLAKPPTRMLLPVVFALGVGACATGVQEGEDESAPTLLGLSKTSVGVGQSIEILGANFAHGSTGHAVVLFEGQFRTKSGAVHEVSYEVRPHWEDGNRLVWPHFGPYTVPFSPTGDEIGSFEGTMTAINVRDLEESFSEPVPVTLDVKPSLIIRGLSPVDAECDGPSKVILDNFDYEVEVEAVGFTPRNFTYITSSPHQAQPVIMRQEAVSNASSFGAGGELGFPPVPANQTFYAATLAIAALGEDGEERVTAITIGVHRPVEFIMYDRVEVAEIEAAQPVSGCIAGGTELGRTVTYTETETQTRSRTVGIDWNETWLNSHSGTVSQSSSATNSIGVSVSESETEGSEINWENGRDIEGGASVGGTLFGLVEVGASGKYTDISRDGGNVYGSKTSGYTVNQDQSITDTESWAFSNTQGYNLSMGGSDFWTVSSSESTIVSFEGEILPGQYGVFYRQSTRMALPGAVIAYNQCGVPEHVADANFYDYTWSVDLGTGTDCPPLPETQLPDAECFIAPCGGAQ